MWAVKYPNTPKPKYYPGGKMCPKGQNTPKLYTTSFLLQSSKDFLKTLLRQKIRT